MAYTTGSGGSFVPERQYAQDRARLQSQIEQLQRQRAPIPQPARAAGGSIVGITEARAATFSTTSGSSGVTYSVASWTITPHTYPATATPPGLTASGGTVTLATEGWYEVQANVRMWWPSGAPSALTVNMQAFNDAGLVKMPLPVALTSGSMPSCEASFMSGRFYAEPTFTQLTFSIKWASGAGSPTGSTGSGLPDVWVNVVRLA